MIESDVRACVGAYNGDNSELFKRIEGRIKAMTWRPEDMSECFGIFMCFENDYFKDFLHMIDHGLLPECVIDIGCQYGFQSEIFREHMKYIGIDVCQFNWFNHNALNVEYRVESFPNLSVELVGATVISNMSLGYFNSLVDGLTDDRIVSELSKCKTLYIGSTPEIIERLKPYFKNFEYVDDGKIEIGGVLKEYPRCAMWK